MNKVRRIRLFSIALMVAFLATSTLTFAATVEDPSDFQTNPEEQFEDKSETGDKDDKSNSFNSNFFLICEVSQPAPSANNDFDDTYTFNLLKTSQQLPIFLLDSSFLI